MGYLKTTAAHVYAEGGEWRSTPGGASDNLSERLKREKKERADRMRKAAKATTEKIQRATRQSAITDPDELDEAFNVNAYKQNPRFMARLQSADPTEGSENLRERNTPEESTNTPEQAAPTNSGNSKIEAIKRWQRRLGVKVDGVWGKKTEAAYQAYMAKKNASSQAAGRTPESLQSVTPGRASIGDTSRLRSTTPERLQSSVDSKPSIGDTGRLRRTARQFRDAYEEGYDENFSKRERRRELRDAGMSRKDARRQARREAASNRIAGEAKINGMRPHESGDGTYVDKNGERYVYGRSHKRADGGPIDISKLKFL